MTAARVRPAPKTGAETGAEAGPEAGDLVIDRVVDELVERLHDYRARVENDPLANPIKRLAFYILKHLEAGSLDAAACERLVQRLTRTAFVGRAQRLRHYLGEVDEEANSARIRDLLRRIGRPDPEGDPVEFESFRRRVERVAYGLVITAHPTFSLALDLERDLVSLAIGRDAEGRPLDEAAIEALKDRIEKAPHRPEPVIDLDLEHALSLEAIGHLRVALRWLLGLVGEVAAELYPDRWQELRPQLVTIASWVGYDTDGRSDIPWTTTLAKRIETQLDQLSYYRKRVEAMRGEVAGEAELGQSLELIDARLAFAIKLLHDELAVFQRMRSPESADEELARVSRDMVALASSRLADSRQLASLVDRAMALAGEDGFKRDLWVLRAEIAAQGLTAARTHVRINAVQLHNAIRKTIGMEHAPDDPGHRLSYVSAVAKLLKEVRPEAINFGSLTHEKATAKRVVMLVRQMTKYLDANEPVRFLIAECETPLTLLSALYFARLFGVEERIDISPLFETQKALDRGVEILRGALEVEAFRSYVRRRGRLCIQTGFSDAGRYLGQIAASFAIERIRIGMADLLVAYGLEDVELVIFDTHGESIGRGAHPDSFADRLRYYDTPYCRRRFATAGVEVIEESSFQGGDGYVYFLSDASAFAVLTRVLEHALEDAGEADDPFYERGHYTDEFFAAIKQFNALVIDDPCYAAFLGAFGPNMLYPSGSRALKRQHERGGGGQVIEHPSQIRAIPHNSILQQLGIMANTIGGVGQAVDKDPDQFQLLYRESPRFRRLMTMVEHAFKFTDLDVVKTYIDLFDAGVWLRRAQLEKDEQRQEEQRRVSDFLEQMRLHDRLSRIFRVFLRDYTDLARALRRHRRLTRSAGDEPIAIDLETRDNLHILHALRLALIQNLMRRAVHVPDFSDRHAATHADLVQRLMRLEVEPALSLLHEIFPLTDRVPELDYGEPATYGGGNSQSYALDHERIFAPLARDYELIRRISSGIIHHIGAIG